MTDALMTDVLMTDVLMTELVVVSVGTDHHPFDRLVGWIESWAAANLSVKVVVQHGTAAAPANVESHELIPHDELRQLFSSAVAVVSHGGPSTVMDARMAGKFPIVVPRDPALGEHVDGHQIRFADHLALHGLARLANSEADFCAALDDAVARPTEFSIPPHQLIAAAGVAKFGEVVDELLDISTHLALDPLEGIDD
ncbi:MAG: UDP-N-acetylglucosamine transferase subunit ALG13 [Acidimicrobiales bacterium]|jgi:UDP-N-acetylglucosamine transferase subunit ALG13